MHAGITGITELAVVKSGLNGIHRSSLLESALEFVRFDHIASRIVNANHSIM